MTSSELMPSEEPPREPSSAKAFSLPEANVTEFSFPLSIHGAWMLEDGIMDYVETTMVMHEQGQQDDGQAEACTGKRTRPRRHGARD